jgi:hypothetical protein
MEPRERPSRNGQGHDDSLIVSTDAIHRIVTSLSVTHGYVQLLHRRVRRGAALNQDELLRMLATLEEATRAMKAELTALDAAGSRPREHDNDT